MIIDAAIKERFEELNKARKEIGFIRRDSGQIFVEDGSWQKWSTSVLSLLLMTLGENSPHYQNFKKIYSNSVFYTEELNAAIGVFEAAKEDYEGGYCANLQKAISGEIFGNFIALAKKSLSEGFKDVAAVLACAALEDSLKRFASSHGLTVDEESMAQVVNALKAIGLVDGAQKKLLDVMPKIRDYAMHANWDKIRPEDISGVIGFVEQFLIVNF